jgi:hypothetical protein
MDGLRCYTRLITKTGTNYMVVETLDVVLGQLEAGSLDEWVDLTSMTGQELFPPERLRVRMRDVVSVQEISEVAWLWTKRLNELHYAQQMDHLENDPSRRMADTQERLVEVLKGENE